MVAIAPFRALRYSPDIVQDLGRVLAPPYDVIDAKEQERLYAASPYNVVRLIYAKQSPTDTHEDNRYTRARGDFNAWCDQQVLRRDAKASFSLIKHAFTWNGTVAHRLGFVGLLQLDEANGGRVFRHEATLEGPKTDRRKLLEAIPANLSPIFCVYPDAGDAVQTLLGRLSQQAPPTSTATVGADVVRMWTVTDAAAIREIQSRLASVSLLIADGHHRYEVAHANRARYGAVMAYFASMDDPALRVRPIHRLVRSQSDLGLEALKSICALQPVSDLAAIMRLQEADAPGQFGCAIRGALYRVAVREEALAGWVKESSISAPVARLDVSLLHGLVFPSLGVEERHLTYTADAVEAVASVEAQASAMAWLVPPIPVDQVYTLASQGFALPPKSTFFYPKVLSGLAFNPFVA